ncbi:MAG: hypothetical protein ACSHYB_03440 [Roseibacillus sp.]
MDKDQIRQNLAGYRPELYQDDDPLIAESLRAAKADPELSAWLDDQIAFDRELAQTLSQAEPPLGSREALLTAYQEQQVVSLPKRRIPRNAVWAAAAILLLSTAGLIKFFAFPPPVEFAQTANPTVETLREQMAYFASQRFVLDETFQTNTESAAWLATEQFPTLTNLPGKLTQYRGMGCKKINWNERKVGLICFKNNDNEIVHLFVLDRTELESNPAHEAEFEKVIVFHDRETKGWSDEKQAYLLVGSEPGVSVHNLL